MTDPRAGGPGRQPAECPGVGIQDASGPRPGSGPDSWELDQLRFRRPVPFWGPALPSGGGGRGGRRSGRRSSGGSGGGSPALRDPLSHAAPLLWLRWRFAPRRLYPRSALAVRRDLLASGSALPNTRCKPTNPGRFRTASGLSGPRPALRLSFETLAGIMSAKSHENLKAIRFAGELLPNWAQLLDLAARLCPVSEEIRHWFSRLTTCAGVEDARTVIDYCSRLRGSIQDHRDAISAELLRSRGDTQPARILGAWMYALDTMIQEAQSSPTCSWTVEGVEDVVIGDSDGGDITLRRV